MSLWYIARYFVRLYICLYSTSIMWHHMTSISVLCIGWQGQDRLCDLSIHALHFSVWQVKFILCIMYIWQNFQMGNFHSFHNFHSITNLSHELFKALSIRNMNLQAYYCISVLMNIIFHFKHKIFTISSSRFVYGGHEGMMDIFGYDVIPGWSCSLLSVGYITHNCYFMCTVFGFVI